MTAAIAVAPGMEPANAVPSAERDARVWPLVALGILLLAQVSMAFTRAINWDEFFFYHQVAAFAGGELESPLQTIHTRLFFWLPGLFDSNVDHIVAARLLMLPFELGTLAGLYIIARRFCDRGTAVLVPLLYLSAGYVLQHGISFRVDPMATALLVGALAVLVRSRLDWKGIALFGALTGLAGMVTIKVVLYLPAFAGLALLRLSDSGFSRAIWAKLVGCGIAGLGVFALLFAWHSSALTAEAGSVDAAPSMLADSLSWMFFIGLPRYSEMAIKSAMLAPVFAVAILVTPILLWRSARPSIEKMALALFWVPILTPFFYTNSAAYFYAYILAPVAIGCLPAIKWIAGRFSKQGVAVAVTAIALAIFAVEDRETIDRQRQLESDVTSLFSQPVTYFDDNYMLSGWPKANGFMTPWGMEKYRSANIASYRESMIRETVPLLLVNGDNLSAVMLEGSDGILMPEDSIALRNNYIALTPFIHVAGKQLAAGFSQDDVEFLVPGTYTLRRGTLTLDGNSIEPGEVVHITRGLHAIAVDETDGALLVWGDDLQAPPGALENGPLYVGF